MLLLLEQENKKERLKEALQAGYDDYKNGRTIKITCSKDTLLGNRNDNLDKN